MCYKAARSVKCSSNSACMAVVSDLPGFAQASNIEVVICRSLEKVGF